MAGCRSCNCFCALAAGMGCGWIVWSGPGCLVVWRTGLGIPLAQALVGEPVWGMGGLLTLPFVCGRGLVVNIVVVGSREAVHEPSRTVSRPSMSQPRGLPLAWSWVLKQGRPGAYRKGEARGCLQVLLATLTWPLFPISAEKWLQTS